MMQKLCHNNDRLDWWITNAGKKILYGDLKPQHLRDIVFEGYRNRPLLNEVHRRGLHAPKRAVDELSADERARWVERVRKAADTNVWADEMRSIENKPQMWDLMLNIQLELLRKAGRWTPGTDPDTVDVEGLFTHYESNV